MKKKKRAVVIILVAALLMIATFMDIWLVFQVTSGQTRDLGSYQLANISGELENTISRAEKLTMQIGITAETYIGDEQAITEYIYRMADELASEETGLFNVYIAGPGWNVLPGMTDPNFAATKRDWYIGAVKNDGSTYVTSPYADAVTGDMCYTVSLMLADGETVIAVDYTMNIMQAYIRRIYAAGSSDAVILTEEGIIAGCSDETMIGKKLSDVLPEYVGLFSLAKNKDEVVIGKVRKDNMTANAVNSARDRYIALGFDDFLSKPIEVKSLVDILRKYLPAEKITERKLASESTAPEADADDDLFIFSPDDDAADFETGTTYADVSELPAVEGADWNYAVSHLATAELVAETVKEFRSVIPSHADKLNEFYAALPDEEALKGYRIQVHAMKSSAATVGIIPLAGMAKVLENAAANGNAERVFQLHDVFESEWRSYEERLKDF